MTRASVTAAWAVLLAVFALSLIGKLADPAGFAFQLETFGLPGRWAWPFTVGLLFVELLIGLGLLLGPYRRRAAAAAAALLLFFATVLAWLLAHGGRGAECGCFGTLLTLHIEPLRIVENVLLSFLAVVVAVGSPDRNGRTAQCGDKEKRSPMSGRCQGGPASPCRV